MKTLIPVLGLLSLSACAARPPSAALVAAAAHPTAEVVGDVLSETGQAEAAARIEAAAVTVTFEPVMQADLGVPTRGYGSQWVLMDRTITRGPATTGTLTVSGAPSGWTPCPTCSDHWIEGQLGGVGPAVKVDPPQEFVPAQTVVTTVTTPRRRNPVGDLIRGVIDGAKFVASPVATMVAAVAETPRALQGNPGPDGNYSMTREAASWLFPEQPSDATEQQVTLDVPGHWRDLPMPLRGSPPPCRSTECHDTIALRRREGASGMLTVQVSATSQHSYTSEGAIVPIGGGAMGGEVSVWPSAPWTPLDPPVLTPLPDTAPAAALDAIRERDATALSDAIAGVDLGAPVDWSGPPATLLHAAVAAEWTDGVALLLAAGADPNAVIGRFGKPPLAYGTATQHVVLVQGGALRTVPELDASVWAAAPLQDGEAGYAARALAVDADLVAPETLRHLVPFARSGPVARARLSRADDVEGVSLHDLRTAVMVDGPVRCGPAVRDDRTAPTRSDVRAAWGRPTETHREGEVWVAQWPGRIAVAQGRDVVRMTDDCAWHPLLGLSRSAVHLAMGAPDYEGPAHELYEARASLSYVDSQWARPQVSGSVWVFRYEDDRLTGVEQVFRP